MSGAKGRKKSHRGQGQSEEQGVTKSRILTYIANTWNGSAGPDDDDIDLYLKKKYNITSKNGIKDHISDLLEDNMLLITQDENGRIYYRLSEDFEDFHRLYNFIHESNCSTEFIQTKYYLRQMDRLEFKAKLVLNFIKGTILLVLGYPKEKRNLWALIKEGRTEAVQSASGTIIRKIVTSFMDLNKADDTGKLKTGTPSNEYSEAVIELLQFLKAYNIDQIYQILGEQPGIDSLTLLTNIVSQQDRLTVFEILKCTPSAMYDLLNQKGYDSIGLAISMFRFYTQAILQDKDKMEIIKAVANKEYSDITRDEAIAIAKYMLDFSHITKESPLVNILRAKLILDYTNGRLALTEYSTITIKQYFDP